MAFDIVIGSATQPSSFDVVIGDSATPTLASGTTLAAMQAGSSSFKYVVAIEGYPYLLTDATPQQAIDAWYGNTDTNQYTQALGGLYVTGDMSAQMLDWRKPFPRGPSLTLHIMPTSSSDTFGVDTHKRNAGGETELRGTIDCDDTSIVVADDSGLSTGDVYIGTECMAVTVSGTDTLTATQRGRYTPFRRRSATGFDVAGFGRYHRYGDGPLEVLLAPRVTAIPRKWVGKWVGVYLHKYDASIPALNAKDDALCVYAGKIVSITDDPATGATVVELKHVLDVVGEHTVGGRDQYQGKIRNVIWLQAGMTFTMRDVKMNGTSFTDETADDLVVVASGASSTNEIDEGYYTPPEVCDKLNAWWAGEKGAGQLNGTYSIGYYLPSDGSVKTYIWWQFSGSASSDTISFWLSMPQRVAAHLGFVDENFNNSVNGFVQSTIQASESGGAFRSRISEDNVKRWVANAYGTTNAALIADERGTFQDQYDFLPGAVKPPSTANDGYGIFLIDGKFLAVGSFTQVVGDWDVVSDLSMLPEQFGLQGEPVDNFWRLELRQGGPEDVDIRQIFVLEGGLADLLYRFFVSTGTNLYNHATYDTLAFGLGIGIPAELVPPAFLNSLNALPHADSPIVLLIDKAIKLSTLLAGEMIVRRASLRWNTEGGYLDWTTWKSPTDSNSVATLVEANKAAPAGNVDHHRSVTTEDGSWAVPIVNIRYNRQLGSDPAGKENYRDTITIVDKAALDDLGGDGPSINIDCRGTFGDFAQTGSTPDSLSAGFMATMPYFSNPARRTSRSIDQRFFVGLSIGDVVTVTDAYARDPDTGLRSVATRYGIVTRHRYSLGGLTPNSDSAQPQGGEVDLFFLDVNRVAAYVPSAQVDSGATNGGYDDGDPYVLTLLPHAYSESTEDADITHFAAGDKIWIVERDPADPDVELIWERTVDSIDANTHELTLTTALSSPSWDSSKKYMVIFDTFDDAQATQQTKTFQADNADNLVVDTRQPFEYGTGGGDGNYTVWTQTDDVELPPSDLYGDGVGRDVATDVALARLLNNLVMFKTGVSSPCLSDAVMSYYVGGGATTWCLVQCRPVKLGSDILLADVYRKVAVAPHYRSTDGSSQSVRVTLSRTPPTDSDYFDVDRGNVIASTTFTTTSTTFATPTPVELDARVKDGAGIVWVYVEVSALAETWGLAHFQETSIRLLHTLVAE